MQNTIYSCDIFGHEPVSIKDIHLEKLMLPKQKTKNQFLPVIFQHKSNKVPNFYFQATISLWHQKTKDAQCQLKLPKKWEIYGVFNLSTNQRGCLSFHSEF